MSGTTNDGAPIALEARIAEWRRYVDRAGAILPEEADELESHLREQVDELAVAGLDADEAFLIGVKRIGAVDAISAEFARTNSARMWKQLIIGTPRSAEPRAGGLWSAIVIGVVAAAAFQLLRLITTGWTQSLSAGSSWLLLDAGLIPVAALAVWMLLRRGAERATALAALVPIAAVVIAVNAFPLSELDAAPQSLALVALHAPIALWLCVGIAYLGPEWRSRGRRMDFVRFTGELLIYYVLVALGGGVLFGIATAVLQPLLPGIAEPLLVWGLYSGAIIAVPCAGWLVENKQRVIENIAPVLARIFTPLFAVVTVAAAIVYLVAGASQPFDRDLMVVFDALLVAVLGLVLYALSARTEGRAARFFDVTELVTIVAALVLDLVVLIHLAARIGDYGWTPNRIAVLGLNLLLVIVLGVAGAIGAARIARHGPIAPLERWLMETLPAYSIWAALVALVLPPVFGFA